MAKLIDIDNKYPLIMALIVIFFLLIVVLAVIFSNVKFEKKAEGTIATIVNDGDLVINYVDGEILSFFDSKVHNYAVTITNTSSKKIYYSLYFSEINIDNIKIKVSDYDGNLVKEIDKEILNNKLINLNSIQGGETLRYYVTIDPENNKTRFKGTLKVVNESLTTETFSDLILLNNIVSVPETRVGYEIATENEGLNSSLDNKGTTYYFRGNVKNNYVKIGDNFFRIVRINGDSTVRLVLDDVIETQSPYNINPLKDGEGVTSSALYANSSLHSTLETWLEKNISDYKTFVTTGDYCTDIIFNNTINGISYSSTYNRIFNEREPDFRCSGSVYSGNIGLLTADEVVFAGAALNNPNDKYYLYNKNIPGNYITLSSYFINTSNNIAMVNVMTNGALGDGNLITNNSYIRPVINISVNAKVKGTGTEKDPYVIVS